MYGGVFRKGMVLAIIVCFIGASVPLNMLTENVKAVDTTGHYQDVWNVNMNGMGDSITVSPGESISISLDYQIWNRIGCPACIAQIVIGIGDTPYYCAYNGIPGTYPGVTGSNTNSITAPLSLGTYDLNFCGHRCYTCSEAFGEYVNPAREKTKIGTITVLEESSNDLIAYWNFDEGNGNIAYDSVGNHDGTLTNMDLSTCWVDGISGNALLFDGFNDYILIPDHDELDLHHWTISAFVRSDGFTSDMSTIVCNGEDTSTDRFNYWFSLYTDSVSDYITGAFEEVYHDDPNKGVQSDPLTDLHYQWNHVVFTRATDGYSRLYFNGNLVGEKYYGYTPAYASAPLYIGVHYDNWGGGFERYFDGYIDEIKIYNYALSHSEINDLYGSYATIKGFPEGKYSCPDFFRLKDGDIDCDGINDWFFEEKIDNNGNKVQLWGIDPPGSWVLNSYFGVVYNEIYLIGKCIYGGGSNSGYVEYYKDADGNPGKFIEIGWSSKDEGSDDPIHEIWRDIYSTIGEDKLVFKYKVEINELHVMHYTEDGIMDQKIICDPPNPICSWGWPDGTIVPEYSYDDIPMTTYPSIAIDIDPDTLNLKSKGKWITCYIELPDGYDVANIDISTILLNDVVTAEDHPSNIGDDDDDGIPDLMIKFDRQAVQDILEPGDNVEIKVKGELIDGTMFEGVDYIRVK